MSQVKILFQIKAECVEILTKKHWPIKSKKKKNLILQDHNSTFYDRLFGIIFRRNLFGHSVYRQHESTVMNTAEK